MQYQPLAGPMSDLPVSPDLAQHPSMCCALQVERRTRLSPAWSHPRAAASSASPFSNTLHIAPPEPLPLQDIKDLSHAMGCFRMQGEASGESLGWEWEMLAG
ncbi:unnamed protein product [Lepidochelys kempii]